jgi:hypothetical protein
LRIGFKLPRYFRIGDRHLVLLVDAFILTVRSKNPRGINPSSKNPQEKIHRGKNPPGKNPPEKKIKENLMYLMVTGKPTFVC